MKHYIFIAGMVYLISKHSISYRLRDWIYRQTDSIGYEGIWLIVYKLVSCPFCLGFWIGCIWSLCTQGIGLYEGVITGIISYAASRD